MIIKIYCTEHTSKAIKSTIKEHKTEITLTKSKMVSWNDARMGSLLEGNSFLHKLAKVALIRHCISCIKDKDSPSAFFLTCNWNNKTPESDGVSDTSRRPSNNREPREIRKAGRDLYTQL